MFYIIIPVIIYPTMIPLNYEIQISLFNFVKPKGLKAYSNPIHKAEF